MADRPLVHGSTNTYTYRGCRCGPCRAARRDYVRALQPDRQRRKVGRTHGIRATYASGCRCEACRRSEADYRRAHRHTLGADGVA